MDSRLELPFGRSRYRLHPGKVICLGLNYREHVAESVSIRIAKQKPEIPSEPVLFPKLPSCIIGSGDPIELPAILDRYRFAQERTDYEGEIALVIGQGGARISLDHALDHVLGITAANDVTQRNIQTGDRSGWFRGKSFDTFLPLGPRIVPLDAFDDLNAITVTTRVNGEERQRGAVGDLIFPFARIVSFVSHNFRLDAGDVILTGTPAGVGPIRHADVVEVEVSAVGVLRNTVHDARVAP